MRSGRLRGSALLASLLCILSAAAGGQRRPVTSRTEHFRLDHNRVFVELEFVRADGTRRKTLAFLDSGDPDFRLSVPLAKELHLDRGEYPHVLFGGMPLKIEPAVSVYAQGAGSFFTGMDVEANLPATVLDQYDVALDYAARTLTLAPPGSLEHEGAPVPCKVNARTGLASVQAGIAGQNYALAVDAGSAYTWIDRAVTHKWASAHKQWLRGEGAVGDANMNGSLPELTGMIMRLPAIDLGGVKMEQAGALGVGPGWDKTMPRFFDWYSQKTPGPVVGFLGGNVLRAFRLEIDYANQATYWKRENELDAHDLDQVGIIIQPGGGKYVVIGMATQDGKKTVDRVAANDRLISVDGVPVTGKTMGTVLTLLHGQPGERRNLGLERGGRKVTVSARVRSF